MNFVIEMVVTACLIAAPTDCTVLRRPTTFVSPVQCQIMSQQALAEIMQPYPKRRVAHYACEMVTGDGAT